MQLSRPTAGRQPVNIHNRYTRLLGLLDTIHLNRLELYVHWPLNRAGRQPVNIHNRHTRLLGLLDTIHLNRLELYVHWLLTTAGRQPVNIHNRHTRLLGLLNTLLLNRQPVLYNTLIQSYCAVHMTQTKADRGFRCMLTQLKCSHRPHTSQQIHR